MPKSYEIPPHTYKSCCDRKYMATGMNFPHYSASFCNSCKIFYLLLLFAFNLSSAVFLSQAVTLPRLLRDHAELLPADY